MFEALDTTASGVTVDYNVAPTDPGPVIRNSTRLHRRVLAIGRWGLLPPWATDRRGAPRMINARAETIATTRAYARPFAANRCLVPAAGWYEFAQVGAGRRKQPYFMTPYAGVPVAFAGIWSTWSPPGSTEAPVLTYSIVTTAAVGPLLRVHDRMPLILSPRRWDAWLGAEDDPTRLLAPPLADDVDGIEIRPVGPAVGDVRSDGPELIAPVRVERHVDLTLF